MLAKTLSAAVIGINAFKIEVEVHSTKSSKSEDISIVGLPDAAVKESKDRIKSALSASGLKQMPGATIVNLAPADIKKEGASFDLVIAMGMLGATNQINRDLLSSTAIMGELALDGTIRPIKGALPIALALAKEKDVKALIVPVANQAEAAVAAGNLPVYSFNHLLEVVNFFRGGKCEPYKVNIETFFQNITEQNSLDFADVKGQLIAKRAMEIAAAGGHNSLMIGPPGTGKSMLAMRLSSILPPMTLDEMLESSRIFSTLGLLNSRELINIRPFRSPHHTISDVALIGGGKEPRAGEISLAHNGVLFLDELPEFKRNVLEVLRQPLENGYINVSRASGSCTFPAKFMLVAAMNPCPCGRGEVELGCQCKVDEKRRYRKKISGPLLDRIDLHIELRQLSQDELLSAPNGESSAKIRERVMKAREIQTNRFKGLKIHCNSQLGSRELQKFCQVKNSSLLLLRQAIEQLKLSPRAYDRILKVSRTIADLSNSIDIKDEHIFEAINYRKSGLTEN